MVIILGKSVGVSLSKKRLSQVGLSQHRTLVDLIGDKDIWLINASAIGFYNFSKEAQDESCYLENIVEQGLSQEIVNKWESVLTKSELQKYTILRFGVVIGNGGVLEKMTMTAKFSILTKFSSGEQLMSWISMFDLVRAFEFVIENNYSQKEVFNLTAPNVTSNSRIIENIKKITKARIVMSMPKVVIKLLFGQMGEELLLSNQNIKPKRLIEEGFEFDDENIDSALKKIFVAYFS